jgi:hypothetical protein
MGHESIHPVWHVRLPLEWPPPPARMSFSDLHTIEQCPRRWSLSMASYPEVWSRRGYPAKVYLGTVRGLVLHRALESIVDALSHANCSSVRGAAFVGMMRDLGGYSGVIDTASEDIFAQLERNPRFARVSHDIKTNFAAASSSLREQLQILTSKLSLALSAEAPYQSNDRRALREGSHTEVELVVSNHNWHGFADLLILSESTCEIIDFKSGDPSPAHTEQILIYSLLWAKDAQLNPNGRLANKLTLSYPTGTVAVAPFSKPDLDQLEETLISRTKQALDAVQLSPPQAIPTPENCTFCSVRQLCDKYWLDTTQQQLTHRGDTSLTDLEVEAMEPQSPTLWAVRILISRFLLHGQRALLRIPHEYQYVVASMKPGERLRIIGGLVIDPPGDDAGTPLIKLIAPTEVFIL